MDIEAYRQHITSPLTDIFDFRQLGEEPLLILSSETLCELLWQHEVVHCDRQTTDVRCLRCHQLKLCLSWGWHSMSANLLQYMNWKTAVATSEKSQSPPAISFPHYWSCRAGHWFEHQGCPATEQKQNLVMSERSWMETDWKETGSHLTPHPWARPPLCLAPSLAASGSLCWWRRRCIPGTESLKEILKVKKNVQGKYSMCWFN